MQFSFNPLLVLSLAGFAIIFSTANPVITHIPIPISSPTTSSFLPPAPLPTLRASVNATSTYLTMTTTLNPGIPLHPSTIQDQAPKTRPQSNGGGGRGGCHPEPSGVSDQRRRRNVNCVQAW